MRVDGISAFHFFIFVICLEINIVQCDVCISVIANWTWFNKIPKIPFKILGRKEAVIKIEFILLRYQFSDWTMENYTTVTTCRHNFHIYCLFQAQIILEQGSLSQTLVGTCVTNLQMAWSWRDQRRGNRDSKSRARERVTISASTLWTCQSKVGAREGDLSSLGWYSWFLRQDGTDWRKKEENRLFRGPWRRTYRLRYAIYEEEYYRWPGNFRGEDL